MNNRDCGSRSFKALITSQFFGAFNDNAFKIMISLLVLKWLPTQNAAAHFLSLVGALFIMPFILFSPFAGYFADRFRKRNVMIAVKVFEVLIMIFGFYVVSTGNLWMVCAALFLMATHSAFFSPAKYGILPEILEDAYLSKGNGYLQMWTFLAIILGSAFGGQMVAIFRERTANAVLILILFSVIGLAASIFVEKGEARNTQAKWRADLFRDSLSALRQIRQNRWLYLTLIGICYFWFLGAVFQMNVLLYGQTILHLSDSQAGLLLAMTSLGIGAGSWLAGYFSEKKIEYGLVPLGSIGISIFCICLGKSGIHIPVGFLLFTLLGIAGGIFVVPLDAYYQQNSPAEQRGKYLGALNIVSSGCILLASGYLWISSALFHMNAAQNFLVLGCCSIAITLYIFRTLPEALLRFLNWLGTHLIYRMTVVGTENIPKTGGALLVCNHIAFADPPLVLASVERPIRFLIFRDIYQNPIIHPFAKAINAIPISYRDHPKGILKSLQDARQAIEDGNLVCIFAEGGLTRTGNMLPFKKGFEHIMKGLDAPIIPMCIDRIWGSIFSFENGRYFWKFPKVWPYPVTLAFGKAMPATSQSHEVRMAVQEMTAEAFKLRGTTRKKLHIAFIDEAKKHPFRFCMADSSGKKMNYLETLTSVLLLSKKLFSRTADKEGSGEQVGIMLPASCGASLVNGATLIAGKIPVNLNFTGSRESLLSCIEQCRMKKIITSRIFLQKAKLEAMESMIYLEDILKSVTPKEKTRSLLAAFLMPGFLIKLLLVRGDKRNVEDLATIIFSSGSTGRPKGVMLSHGNIFSNIEALYQVLSIKAKDVVMGALPFFHSFGFTGTLCMPVGLGIGVVYHNNPMDAAKVGELVQKYKATILMGTPTFLAAYVRKCTKEQFSSLRYVVAGAEKMKTTLSEAFREKFNLTPFEGYGATELSPIVALGVPDYVSDEEKIHQVGHKSGSVGHPIPGVAVKTVDPDTGEVKDYEEEGLLLVKGPNVMIGYLADEVKTQEVLQDGWYRTGDMAKIDKDGFIHITDRLSRFSKIGGEMVPHIRVEEKILEALEAVEPVCAVSAVPDEKKGERLVVLYRGEISVDDLWEKLNASDLPKLWIPKRDDFYRVDEIPLLGSGKLDLKRIKAMASEVSKNNSAEAAT
jgi:acyl-[acyl-carrier-protein]-phospholipid O-acyltransferase/long-chain-fatty-acid--[acyl-carrier-protein] ligase